jgi:CBS domain-containing protein
MVGALDRRRNAIRDLPELLSGGIRGVERRIRMKIGQIYSRPVVSVPASATLAEVATLMKDHQVGAVVITKAPADRPVPVGMITDRDIVRAQLDHSADLNSLCAEDVMTLDPLLLNIDDSLDDAIQRLRGRGVRRAPVITSSGALAGLVSIDDLLDHVAHELSGLARLVTRQPGRGEAR